MAPRAANAVEPYGLQPAPAFPAPCPVRVHAAGPAIISAVAPPASPGGGGQGPEPAEPYAAAPASVSPAPLALAATVQPIITPTACEPSTECPRPPPRSAEPTRSAEPAPLAELPSPIGGTPAALPEQSVEVSVAGPDFPRESVAAQSTTEVPEVPVASAPSGAAPSVRPVHVALLASPAMDCALLAIANWRVTEPLPPAVARRLRDYLATPGVTESLRNYLALPAVRVRMREYLATPGAMGRFREHLPWLTSMDLPLGEVDLLTEPPGGPVTGSPVTGRPAELDATAAQSVRSAEPI